jgi:hypothetical protein
MPSRSTKAGTCALCGHQAAKAKMVAHLTACVIAHEPASATQPLLMLRLDAAHDPRYWILVEARADASLQQLDTFLRQLWLECCGHLSAFFVDRREVGMGARVDRAFDVSGGKFHHEYDFGSTTALNGQVLVIRQGAIGRVPIRLLARNDSLRESCTQCATLATVLCPYCLDTDGGLLCDAHAESHEHAEDEAYLPVVNSPRMGVCGYTV